MTSRQHQLWINRGKPDRGLCLPLQLLANTLAAAGYTVYVYPNDAHLDAQPPEDHTYYSETGWPGSSPYGWRHAIDIMPSGHLPSLQQIGQRIFDERQAGRITWLKYMNWPSNGNLSQAVQDRWEPSHQRGSSGDVGHIHLSSTTGCETLDSSFNPLAHASVTGGFMDALPPLQQWQMFERVEAIEKGLASQTDDGAGHKVIEPNGVMSAIAALSAKVDALVARVDALSAPASGDVTVTGTLHLGGQS